MSIDRLAFACRQAAGIAGNCERGNLLVDAADCLEECRDTGALLVQAIAERNQALAERAEANRAALRFANREAEFSRLLGVADGGHWQGDWAMSIKRMVKYRDDTRAELIEVKRHRDELEGRVRELEGLVADLMAESSRKA